MNQNTKMLVGAAIAAALAIAVYYGAISQQTATNIQGQANQTLGTAPASQQGAPANAQSQADTTTPQNSPAPQNSAPTTPH